MKKNIISCFLAVFALVSFGSSVNAQFIAQSRSGVHGRGMAAYKTPPVPSEHPVAGGSVVSGIPSSPLSALVAVPSGLDSLPVSGSFQFQSDGRPLHNIQIDPDHPNQIHAVITDALDPSAADTALLLTRRCFYTYSSDGGAHWKAPVTFSTVRTGYADMQLFKRNGVYVPIIAAHRVLTTTSSDVETGVWIEKGNPGDGNFAECLAPTVSADGVAGSNILWPTVAMSPTNDTAYVIGTIEQASTTDPPGQLQFGRFIMNSTQDSAVFDGSNAGAWIAAPGEGDPNNPYAGVTSSGGGSRIRVSPSGTIGIFWINDNYDLDGNGPDFGAYFVESTDGGNTWPTSNTALWSPAAQNEDNNGAQLTPSDGDVDFWFDGENPKFFMLLTATIISSSDGEYYPSTATPSFFNPTDGTGQIVPIVSTYLTNAQDPGAFLDSLPVGTTVFTSSPIISWATIARTSPSDTNDFAIFYQAFAQGDTELINAPADPTQDTSFCFGSIYYQETSDGGETWSLAAPLLAASATTPKFDYRQPSTSDFNPPGVYNVVAVMDTAPGDLYRNGIYGFDIQNYAMATLAGSSGVNSGPSTPSNITLTPNFPEPFVSSTTIQFTLTDESDVQLTVTDVLGRSVATLVNGRLGVGSHSVVFNGGNLADGIYRYTLVANGASVTKSMSLLR
jgi:hypothetical protein